MLSILNLTSSLSLVAVVVEESLSHETGIDSVSESDLTLDRVDGTSSANAEALGKAL